MVAAGLAATAGRAPATAAAAVLFTFAAFDLQRCCSWRPVVLWSVLVLGQLGFKQLGKQMKQGGGYKWHVRCTGSYLITCQRPADTLLRVRVFAVRYCFYLHSTII